LAYLIDSLAENRPDDLAAAFEDAVSCGARWQARLAATLAQMPETIGRLAGAGARKDLLPRA
jgi:hypothetical protein